MYNYKNEITEEPEAVLITKTLEGKYSEIVSVIKSHIDFDIFIGELNVDQVNASFESWLTGIVK